MWRPHTSHVEKWKARVRVNLAGGLGVGGERFQSSLCLLALRSFALCGRARRLSWSLPGFTHMRVSIGVFVRTKHEHIANTRANTSKKHNTIFRAQNMAKNTELSFI